MPVNYYDDEDDDFGVLDTGVYSPGGPAATATSRAPEDWETQNPRQFTGIGTGEGWFADPSDIDHLRWWDGQKWTGDTWNLRSRTRNAVAAKAAAPRFNLGSGELGWRGACNLCGEHPRSSQSRWCNFCGEQLPDGRRL